MLKKFLSQMYIDALIYNDENVQKALAMTGPHKCLLDVGCDDGALTMKFAESAKAKKIYGIEIVKEAADKAKEKGVDVYAFAADRERWPFKDKSIDCIVTDQVVEHLPYLDYFFSESSRVLTPGGYFINSTNNLSSWHNIFALLFGWAPFDLTNSSAKSLGIGNPFAIHANETDTRGASWTHKCIYTARWLSDWQSLYGFKNIDVLGSGLYPFPASLGNTFKNHCAFFTLITQKESKGKK